MSSRFAQVPRDANRNEFMRDANVRPPGTRFATRVLPDSPFAHYMENHGTKVESYDSDFETTAQDDSSSSESSSSRRSQSCDSEKPLTMYAAPRRMGLGRITSSGGP